MKTSALCFAITIASFAVGRASANDMGGEWIIAAIVAGVVTGFLGMMTQED